MPCIDDIVNSSENGNAAEQHNTPIHRTRNNRRREREERENENRHQEEQSADIDCEAVAA